MSVEQRITYSLFHHPAPSQPSTIISAEQRITYILFPHPELS
jgi:hypothetical protein